MQRQLTTWRSKTTLTGCLLRKRSRQIQSTSLNRTVLCDEVMNRHELQFILDTFAFVIGSSEPQWKVCASGSVNFIFPLWHDVTQIVTWLAGCGAGGEAAGLSVGIYSRRKLEGLKSFRLFFHSKRKLSSWKHLNEFMLSIGLHFLCFYEYVLIKLIKFTSQNY